MKRFLLASVVTLAAFAAQAADMVVKSPLAVPGFTCTVASCSGWYGGAVLVGEGTNADIIGQGVNNSVFAAGGIIGGDFGYRLWNGNYFFAAEVAAGYQSANSSALTAFTPSGFVGTVLVKAGASLYPFFGGGVPAPSQGPVAVPTNLMPSLMSPYIQTGEMWRQGTTQWVSGAGAEFIIGPRWTLDLSYLYAPPINNLNATNLVKLGVNYNW
jgi:opacity protein-like surface antigen